MLSPTIMGNVAAIIAVLYAAAICSLVQLWRGQLIKSPVSQGPDRDEDNLERSIEASDWKKTKLLYGVLPTGDHAQSTAGLRKFRASKPALLLPLPLRHRLPTLMQVNNGSKTALRIKS